MLEVISKTLWAITTSLIIIIGIYFSKILKYPQLNIKKIFFSLKNTNNNKISPLKTLYLTLAGRIGVGSIAGVALAIYIGGPGTIFWMWLIALISGSLAYTETLLSIKYKIISNNENFGGPSYYIKKGLNKKHLGLLYSLIVVIAYIIGFIPIQSNTISRTININNLLLGIILALITFFIINGGLKKITNVTNKLVPLMTIIYIFLSLIVIFTNLNKFVDTLFLIIKSAFDLKPFFSGFIVTILIGIQRGIFSNESGIGLGGIAASTSTSNNGCQSGYVQVLGIYVTTILICTATAFMILIFDYQNILINNPNGIEITKLAFNHHFGAFGNILLSLCIILFSFTTILTGYYYSEASLKFIYKNINQNILKLVVAISVLIGTISSPKIVWNLVDILVAFLALINIYALYKLRKEILTYHQKYDRI